jgi:predicted transposase/invertase (TIGR01784 family)
MLAPLDNGTIFKTAFTDKVVFTQFVKDILGIDIEVDKIETEKKFEPKVGNIDISLDIFAESIDHRVIIGIQRVDYDDHIDWFLHNFFMATAQLQQNAQEYKLDKTVYIIVVLTAPYKIDKKDDRAIRDKVLIISFDLGNLADKNVPDYDHKITFQNHRYRDEDTPTNYRDWLDLFYESIHNPENYNVNLDNEGIKKAVELIDFDRLDPSTVHLIKIDAQRKVVRKMVEEEGIERGRKEGAEEEKVKIAKQLKANGVSIELISKSTGLSKEEIEKL